MPQDVDARNKSGHDVWGKLVRHRGQETQACRNSCPGSTDPPDAAIARPCPDRRREAPPND